MIDSFFSQAGIQLSPEQIVQFEKLLELFKDWNSKINLSAIRDDEGIIIKHFVDSLLITKYVDFADVQTLVDVGTGGGFPGIPLAIVYPHLQVTLCDSVQKKLKAVKAMADELGLQNVKIISERAEVLGHDSKYRESFDIATARAVAGLSTLLEYLSPLVHSNGHVVAYKAQTTQEEISGAQNAMDELELMLGDIYEDQLPGEEGHRAMIVFDKLQPLSKVYPRHIGVPKKDPL